MENWSGLLRNRYRWVLTLVLALPILQQLSGINTVVFYSSLVFASAGINNPIAATVLVGAVNLAMTFVASALMDAKGRKALILLSHGGMAGCLVVMLGASLLASLLHGVCVCVCVSPCCMVWCTRSSAQSHRVTHRRCMVDQHHHPRCCVGLHFVFCTGRRPNTVALHRRSAARQHQGTPA